MEGAAAMQILGGRPHDVVLLLVGIGPIVACTTMPARALHYVPRSVVLVDAVPTAAVGDW